jgi:uncharacterized membrane protein
MTINEKAIYFLAAGVLTAVSVSVLVNYDKLTTAAHSRRHRKAKAAEAKFAAEEALRERLKKAANK